MIASVICPGFIKQAGMFQRIVESTGVNYPTLVGASAPPKVAQAVLRAIKQDMPEVIVNPIPIKPILILQALAPRLVERLSSPMGLDVFKKAAQVREAEATGSPLKHEI